VFNFAKHFGKRSALKQRRRQEALIAFFPASSGRYDISALDPGRRDRAGLSVLPMDAASPATGQMGEQIGLYFAETVEGPRV